MSTLAFELAGNGFKVSACPGQPTYHHSEKIPADLNEKNVNIHRVYSTRFSKNSTIGRILNSATFVLSVFFHLLFRKRVDLIIQVTNPPILLWVVRFLQIFRNIPVILVVHDVYPQIIAAVGKMSENSILYRLWQILSKWAYRKAARIVVLGNCMEKIVQSQLPPHQTSKIVVIPNWDDENFLQPIPRDNHPTIKEWQMEQKFIILYAGNIGLFHEIETVVNAAEKLQQTNVQFVFNGDGGQAPWLQNEIQRRNLKNITIMPFRPKEQMPLTLTACDVGLITLKKRATGLCVLSKLYGILAVGKPVIAVMSNSSHSAKTILKHNCGIVIDPGDIDNLVSQIMNLKSDKLLLKNMAENARKTFEKKYTLKTISKKYIELINQALAN